MNRFIKLFLMLFLLPCKLLASANLAEGSLIRDAEIEAVLKSYIEPIFKVANLNPKDLHLYIINTKEVNAFAMGGGRIGINTGLILKADSALQVIGVLAHETAHLAGNHIIRGVDAYEKALLQTILGTIGGLALGLAGAPDAGLGIMLGSQDYAHKGFLKFNRTQEGAADQGAARFLDNLGWSSRGMVEFMDGLRKDDFFIEKHVDPYILTHPLPSERVDFFRTHLGKSPHANAPLPPDFDQNFKRIQVKIGAFLESPTVTLSRINPTDASLIARYGRAIGYFRNSQIEEALKEIDSLLVEFPDDPFFWDLKGQILFESGKIRDAGKAYERAVKLRPDIPLIRVNWAHALIEGGDDSQVDRAFKELLRAKTEEPDCPFTYRLLAVCYGKKGETGLAALSLAEMGLQIGDLKQAEQQAKRSLAFFKNDKINEARAKDILEEVKRLRR